MRRELVATDTCPGRPMPNTKVNREHPGPLQARQSTTPGRIGLICYDERPSDPEDTSGDLSITRLQFRPARRYAGCSGDHDVGTGDRVH